MHNKIRDTSKAPVNAPFQFPEKTSTGLPNSDFGCLICGAKNEILEYNGTERAHIFADGKVTNLPWNILSLCPRCHQSFDTIIKPYIANAFEFAAGGFLGNPIDTKTYKNPFTLTQLTQLLREENIKEQAIAVEPTPTEFMFTQPDQQTLPATS